MAKEIIHLKIGNFVSFLDQFNIRSSGREVLDIQDFYVKVSGVGRGYKPGWIDGRKITRIGNTKVTWTKDAKFKERKKENG